MSVPRLKVYVAHKQAFNVLPVQTVSYDFLNDAFKNMQNVVLNVKQRFLFSLLKQKLCTQILRDATLGIMVCRDERI